MSAVGKPWSRVEGRKKVTGGALYTADVAPTGTLHGSLVNSTIASGRVKRLKIAAAVAAPGVVGIFSSANMTPNLAGKSKPTRQRTTTVAAWPSRRPT